MNSEIEIKTHSGDFSQLGFKMKCLLPSQCDGGDILPCRAFFSRSTSLLQIPRDTVEGNVFFLPPFFVEIRKILVLPKNLS